MTYDPNAPQSPQTVGEPTPAPIDPVPTDPERFVPPPGPTYPASAQPAYPAPGVASVPSVDAVMATGYTREAAEAIVAREAERLGVPAGFDADGDGDADAFVIVRHPAVYPQTEGEPVRAFTDYATAKAQADALGEEVYQEGVAFGVRPIA